MKKFLFVVAFLFLPSSAFSADSSDFSVDHFVTIPVLWAPMAETVASFRRDYPAAFENDTEIGKSAVLRMVVVRHHSVSELRQVVRNMDGYVLEVYRNDKESEVRRVALESSEFVQLKNLACEALETTRQAEQPWFTAHSTFYYAMSYCPGGLWSGVASLLKEDSKPDLFIDHLMEM